MRRELSIAFVSGVARMSTFPKPVRLCVACVETALPGVLTVRNGAGQLTFAAFTGDGLFTAASFFPGANNPPATFAATITGSSTGTGTGTIDGTITGNIDPVTGDVAETVAETTTEITDDIFALAISGGSTLPAIATVSVAIPPDFIILPTDTVALTVAGGTGVVVFTVEDFEK